MALTKEKVNIIGEWFARRIKEDGADVKPVKHGRWVKNEEGDYHCSECKAIVESDEKYRHYWVYCYHCGAKMDEVIEV